MIFTKIYIILNSKFIICYNINYNIKNQLEK